MDTVDVCVVGSGAGGAPVALELVRAGMRVVVLEKGPAYSTADMVHDELRVVRRNFFVPFVSDEPHVSRASSSEADELTNFGWIACCVGGGTVHWAGYAYRLAPDDFRKGTVTGGVAGASLADWPISYADLEPWYAKAEAEIGVSGVSGDSPFEPWRSSPFPMPPMRAHPIAERVDRAGRQLHLSPYATPRALLSQPYQGRKACVYCNFCSSYGCEVAAKGSTADALLPRAIATRRCEIRPGCMVRQVRTDSTGRAASVVYTNAAGVEEEQKARLIVVACSAIETPRLLLNSGLANQSGLVGKNLTLMTLGSASADFTGIAEPTQRSPFIGRSVRDYYAQEGTLSFDFANMSPISVAEKLSAGPDGKTLWGKELKDRLRRFYRDSRHVEVEAFSECLPVVANAVDVGSGVKDRFGLPVARVTFSHHAADLQASARLVTRATAVLEAMKPERMGESRSGAIFDVLQGGTCRFGTDPSRSVLDRDCQAHDVPNLYVTDGSVMPTSGGVPPTLTIIANAFRVAQTIIERAKRREVP